MPKKSVPPPYPPELRARLIDQVRAGQTPEELGRKFEPTAQSIRNWVRQADLDAGKRTDSLTSEERVEFVRLRRENRTLPDYRKSAFADTSNAALSCGRSTWRTKLTSSCCVRT
jgi:transposase